MIDSKMRYTFLGDKMTDERLQGMQCRPVFRDDGKCIVSVGMATALVVDDKNQRHVVPRRRLRLNSKLIDDVMRHRDSETGES